MRSKRSHRPLAACLVLAILLLLPLACIETPPAMPCDEKVKVDPGESTKDL